VASVALASPAVAAECHPAEPVLWALQRMKATQMTTAMQSVARRSRTVPDADHVVVAELPAGSLVLMLVQRTSVCATLMIRDPRTARRAKDFIVGPAS
jgi:hypothetical protein